MKDIRRRILEGATLAEIGSELGISRQRVHQLCQQHSIDVQSLIAEREQKILQAIRRLANQGLSIGEIANELSLTYCQVRERTSANGIKCKVKRGITKC